MAHLADNDLRTFFSLEPDRAIQARVVRHLLSACDNCRRRAAEILSELGLDIEREIRDSEIFFQALPELLRASSLIQEEWKRATVSFAHLAPLPARERLALVKKSGRYKKYGLALYMLDEADAHLAKRRSAKAKELVLFSMDVAALLRVKLYGEQSIADLRLRQLTTLANIRRGEEDFMGALETLQTADDMRHESTDPLEEARFLRVQAALLYDVGDFESAATASRESAEVYELLGDLHSEAKALLQEAMILAEFDPATGLLRADEGLDLLNPADSYAYVCGIFNRAFCMVQLHQAEDAAEYLGRYREIIRKVSNPGRELMFRWLDGKIMLERKRYRDAEEVFSYVALRFSEEGMHQEMLLVHIDRIELRIAADHWKSALNIARHLTPELTKLGLRHDLLSVWASFQDALAARQALLADVRAFFRRHWNTRAGLGSLLPK
jgi:hypothetical protein